MKKFVLILASVVVILLIFAGAIDVYFNGTPWGRAQAQTKISQILQKKCRDTPYKIVKPAFWVFDLNQYSVGVIFKKYPRAEYYINLTKNGLEYEGIGSSPGNQGSNMEPLHPEPCGPLS